MHTAMNKAVHVYATTELCQFFSNEKGENVRQTDINIADRLLTPQISIKMLVDFYTHGLTRY